jgi:3-carboxy-cis,cis-muconate cycloisomerase
VVDTSEWRANRFDPARIADEGVAAGNPVEPLVRALGSEYAHWGATSQDILDTAAMLVARRTIDLLVPELDRVAAACAQLAEQHRSTVMAARTLLQHAVPTTFGLKCAGWLVGIVEARGLVRDVRLTAQLGGAGGTLAAYGDRGIEVLRRYASEVGLEEPVAPWHTNRVRVADLGSALAAAAGACAKIALDVALLAQTEVGEVLPPAGGVSSTLPHKRNPVGSAVAIACARQVNAHASVLIGSLVQEHERAVGSWHAEWLSLGSALALTGGAAAAVRTTLEGLEVDTERMEANVRLTGDLIVAEQVAFALAEQHGRRAAHELVAEAAARGRSLDAPEPETYLGSADAFVDRALELYRREVGA